MNTRPNQQQQNSDQPQEGNGYILPRKNPLMPLGTKDSDNPAVSVIREKLAKIYAKEPDALQEEKQAEKAKPRSKHQQFMYDLNHSGKDLAQIQTEWHNYYVALSDSEKHEVWQEFYESSSTSPVQQTPSNGLNDAEKLALIRSQLNSQSTARKAVVSNHDDRSTHEIQDDIRKKTRQKPKSKAMQQLQSLAFGLSIGFVTLVIFLFSFFNEVIIAPLIQPARNSSATPLILTSDTVAPSAEPEIIIPKINVRIPVRYDISSTSEATMQAALDTGIAHYPTTAQPGQNGNAAFFGHSSNNIFNSGKYKFAFVLLHQLVPGDTFYITKDGNLYAYKVFNKLIVKPNQVEVLNPIEGHQATATLITCDPPGTTLNRLVIQADQIKPDPSTNSDADPTPTSNLTTTGELAGNGQSLWDRFFGNTVSKVVVILTLIGIIVLVLRSINRRQPPSNWPRY